MLDRIPSKATAATTFHNPPVELTTDLSGAELARMLFFEKYYEILDPVTAGFKHAFAIGTGNHVRMLKATACIKGDLGMECFSSLKEHLLKHSLAGILKGILPFNYFWLMRRIFNPFISKSCEYVQMASGIIRYTC